MKVTDRTLWSKYTRIRKIGMIGERIAADYLRQQGFTVMEYGYIPFGFSATYNKGFDRTILDTEGWKELGRFIAGLRANKSNRQKLGTPDLLAQKHGKTYVVEVKLGKSQLTKNQRQILERARELGFPPMLVRVDLKVEGNIDIEEV